MPELITKSWEEFEQKLAELNTKKSIQGIWYRGQSDSSWPLNTTLERRIRDLSLAQHINSVRKFYQLVSTVKPEIETFTDRKWTSPNYEEIQRFSNDYGALKQFLRLGDLPGHEYLIYLRHHGFPSPLLDWTRSPYVAAFFAFRNVSRGEAASIFAFSETPENMKLRSSGTPSSYSIGPNVNSHKRHFLQQSAYTICVQFDAKDGWRFAEHESVFQDKNIDPEFPQDILWKITIPFSERVKILKKLDEFNLNAFSLFGSDESLMETAAIREIDFQAYGLQ